MKKQSQKNTQKKRLKKKSSKASPKNFVGQAEYEFQVGQAIRVKKGIFDPDYDFDIGGWSGTIYHVDAGQDPIIAIDWDCETLSKMTKSLIDRCEKDNLNYKKMNLLASELEPYNPNEDGKK